jgi:hypothetical protein
MIMRVGFEAVSRHVVRTGLVALVLLGACGGEVDEDLEAVESRRNAIQNWSAGQGFEFVRSTIVAPTDGPAITPTLEPTICTNRTGMFLVATRDDQSRYQTLYGFGPLGHYHTDWTVHSGNPSSPRLFNTRPASAMREDDVYGNPRFVLVGKSTDNRLYASTGTLPPPHVSLPTPTVTSDWTALNTRTYGNGQQSPGPASPVLASSPNVNAGMVLAFISGSTVWAHYHALPYAGNSWQARVAAPALPTGATPVGTPAITFLDGWAQVFHVVVRAQVGSQYKLYETYFGYTTTGYKFCGIMCGSMAPTWVELPITGAIDSSPALEYSPQLGAETLYFRSGSDYKQTSGYATAQQLGTLPVLNMYPPATSFTGAPSAVAGYQLEMGTHLMVSTYTTNNTTKILLLESQADGDLIP